jgi:autotransporter translocation and assembly factor TamB
MRRRVARALVGLLYAVAALIVALIGLVLAAACYLSTDHGRQRFLRAVVADVNRSLPGTISVRELSLLSPTHFVLHGFRLHARGGDEVLAVETARIQLRPGALLRGRLVLSELWLEDAAIDLRLSDEPQRGLLPALVDPNTAPRPERDGSARELSIEALRLERWHLRLPSATPWAPRDMRLTTVQARLSAGPVLRLDIERLQAEIPLQKGETGRFSVRGHWTSSGVSEFALEGRACGVEVDLMLSLGEPGRRFRDMASNWRRLPFALQLGVRELTAARLAELTASTLVVPTVSGSIAAQLELRGVPEGFDVRAAVQTAGGTMSIQGASRELSMLQVDARTEGLALRRLTPNAPDWRVAGQIAITLQRERADSSRARLAAKTSLSVDGTPLPSLTWRLKEEGASIWRLELELDERWLALSAQGTLAGDGSARAVARGWVEAKEGLELARAFHLPQEFGVSRLFDDADASGRVELSVDLTRSSAGQVSTRTTFGSRALELGGARLESLAAAVSFAADVARPRLRVEASWHAARKGTIELTPGRLELVGSASRYRLDLRGGSLGFGSFAASGWFEKATGSRRFGLTATGQYEAVPWRLEVKRVEWLDTGEVELPNAELELCEQRLHVRGRYASGASRLELTVADVDISRLMRPFAPAIELTGTLNGRFEARGDLERPELSLSLRMAKLRVARSLALDAQLDSTLDARRGVFQLQARARETGVDSANVNPRVDLTLEAASRFEPLRPWPQNFLAGGQHAKLDIRRLDSSSLTELIGAQPSVSFDVHGSVEVDVRQGIPTVASVIEGRLDWLRDTAKVANEPAGESTARMKQRLLYEAGRVETKLALSDGLGPWIELQGNVDLFAAASPTVLELLHTPWTDWQRLVREASWQVDLDAERRSLDDLPVSRWLGRLSGGALGARLSAHRDRGASPEGTLALEVGGSVDGSTGAACSSRLLTARGWVTLEAGRFELEIAAFGNAERQLHLTSTGELDVTAWLAGRTPKWPAFEVAIEARHLPLERLPFVCGELRGRLTGNGRLRDPFGMPEAAANLGIEGLSLGSAQSVDLKAQVSLDPRRLELAGNVTASGRRSSFEIRFPRVPTGTSPRPVEASLQLSGLPLAPLLPPRGPITHVSGQVSGDVRASGSDNAPRLSGNLRIEGVALTVTELAQALSDINGELSLSDDTLVLKGISARDGKGRLTLNGELELDSAQNFQGKLQLATRKFPLRQAGEIVAETTANAQIEAVWRPPGNRLRVVLTDFDTWLERRAPSRGMSLKPHPDLRLKQRSLSAPEPAARDLGSRPGKARAPGPTRPLLIEIDAANHFWVKRADFAFKLSADLTIDVDPDERDAEKKAISVTGQLRFDRGYMEVMGKSFEVKRGGLLRFTGGTSAVLDLTAQYEDRRSSRIIVIRLQGSVAAPKLDFLLDGQHVTAGQAFQAIYGSHASSDDVDVEAQANQIIGALMAGVLTTSMRRKLGSMAPLLSVDAADDSRGEQLRAGFELDALIPEFLRKIVTGVYVEGSISSEKQNDQNTEKDVQSGVLIEFYFSHDLVTSGRYGPDATWSLDLGWQPRSD